MCTIFLKDCIENDTTYVSCGDRISTQCGYDAIIAKVKRVVDTKQELKLEDLFKDRYFVGVVDGDENYSL